MARLTFELPLYVRSIPVSKCITTSHSRLPPPPELEPLELALLLGLTRRLSPATMYTCPEVLDTSK